MYICLSVFSFLDNNLSKYQWIFTILGMCIDIGEIWFRIAMGKFCQFLTVICPHTIVAGYYCFTFLLNTGFLDTYEARKLFGRMTAGFFLWNGLSYIGSFCSDKNLR